KEAIQFFYIARGSSAEVRTFLHLAIALKYVSQDKGLDMIDQYKKISSMLYRLIETRKKTINGERLTGNG
ncbi:MAG: four helix bundle protein, partial [Prevotellaceae bacterium]|nr:four helix bundle protein [Prevotellaceae bacterium]